MKIFGNVASVTEDDIADLPVYYQGQMNAEVESLSKEYGPDRDFLNDDGGYNVILRTAEEVANFSNERGVVIGETIVEAITKCAGWFNLLVLCNNEFGIGIFVKESALDDAVVAVLDGTKDIEFPSGSTFTPFDQAAPSDVIAEAIDNDASASGEKEVKDEEIEYGYAPIMVSDFDTLINDTELCNHISDGMLIDVLSALLQSPDEKKIPIIFAFTLNAVFTLAIEQKKLPRSFVQNDGDIPNPVEVRKFSNWWMLHCKNDDNEYYVVIPSNIVAEKNPDYNWLLTKAGIEVAPEHVHTFESAVDPCVNCININDCSDEDKKKMREHVGFTGESVDSSKNVDDDDDEEYDDDDEEYDDDDEEYDDDDEEYDGSDEEDEFSFDEPPNLFAYVTTADTERDGFKNLPDAVQSSLKKVLKAFDVIDGAGRRNWMEGNGVSFVVHQPEDIVELEGYAGYYGASLSDARHIVEEGCDWWELKYGLNGFVAFIYVPSNVASDENLASWMQLSR
jgi:hypothetical protein